MDGMSTVTAALGGRIAFGGDYNPEQWPEEVWAEDSALMREAGVNLVTVGVFAWSLLEPEEGRYEFGWLDRVLDLLHDGGIMVDLATATASPPAWFSHRYPNTLLVDADGRVRSFGARQAYCPSAPEYRRAATALATQLAHRYAQHPAVVLWHVNNEYGCHNWHCFCEVSAEAFRTWLRGRYGELAALNEAWATTFWSQRYSAWDQVGPPRTVAYNTFANPGQQLDWWRFCSDELLACYRAEADAVRAVAQQPVTTNFMGLHKPVDYRAWARYVDVVSNDHYLLGEDPHAEAQLAMTADLVRSCSSGAPWLVMEQSTSAVNWQARNIAKAPGQLRRNAMAHVARGADGALFFQWRASRAGAEKFHSALVPHAGTDTKVWREVVALGTDLGALGEVVGTRVAPASVAICFDWTSWWAAELDSHPSIDVSPAAELRRWHETLWARNVGVDIVGPQADTTRYRLLIVPVQYLLDDAAASALSDYVEAGGTLLVTYFSGIVDAADHVRLGGYPGALRDVLGLRIEEFFPLRQGETVPLSRFGPGLVWSELGRTTTAESIASYTGGPIAGSPAITRNRYGAGTSWYVGTQLGAGLGAVLEQVLGEADVHPAVVGLPSGVEAVRRTGERHSYLFLINHTDADVSVPAAGVDLLTGRVGDPARVAAGAVAVVREG
jgi:beta-galactosidase